MERNVMKGEVLKNAEGRKMVQERKRAGHGQAVQRAFMTAGAIVGAVLIIGAMVSPLCAQSYPNKPMQLVLGYAPGGNSDIMARIIGRQLSVQLGQPVVVENKPGSAANIAYQYVAKAKPDGYTIVLCASSIAISHTMNKQRYYDVRTDFEPIGLVAQSPYLLAVRSSLPINSLKELVAYAKANPGKLNYGSTGVGGGMHLVMELMKSQAEINLVHVPYKVNSAAALGLLTGEIDAIIANPLVLLPHMQSGKVRALAVLQDTRLKSLPNLPTSKEAGIYNVEAYVWYGFLAPAGTPRDIVTRLNAELNKIVAMPKIQEQMKQADFEPLPSTPEYFSEFIKSEIARWAKVIKDGNIPQVE